MCRKLDLSEESIHKEYFQATTLDGIKVVEVVMKWGYDEIISLHKEISPLSEMQEELKGRGELIKQVFIARDYIYGWIIKYPNAPIGLPRKDRMIT